MAYMTDIKGIDKESLLEALWTHAKPASFSGRLSPPFDHAGAKQACKAYIDYYAGRCIKTDISGDKVDPSLYDREYGIGSFASVVTSLCK